MSDNLRDRIAAAITDGIIAGDGHGKIADAVIRELGVVEETARNFQGQVVRRLRFTEWNTDE